MRLPIAEPQAPAGPNNKPKTIGKDVCHTDFGDTRNKRDSGLEGDESRAIDRGTDRHQNDHSGVSPHGKNSFHFVFISSLIPSAKQENTRSF